MAAVPTRRELVRAIWPFALLYVVAFGLTWVMPGGPEQRWLVLLSGAALVICGVVVVVAMGRPDVEWPSLVAVGWVCIAVSLLREGSGNPVGYGPLLIAPVIWQAMRRSSVYIWATIAMVSLANLHPVAMAEDATQRAVQTRSFLLLTLLNVAASQSIRLLVRDRSQLLERFSALATTDPLTGLPNRRRWDDELPAAADAVASTGRPFAMVLLDLDRFKDFNDGQGHEEGDRLLVETAAAWQGTLRDQDLLVRWGGEEFALLLPEVDRDDVFPVVARLHDVMPRGQTFSAGFTVERAESGGRSARDVFRAADGALYEAKMAGRARVACADDHTIVVLDPPARPG